MTGPLDDIEDLKRQYTFLKNAVESLKQDRPITVKRSFLIELMAREGEVSWHRVHADPRGAALFTYRQDLYGLLERMGPRLGWRRRNVNGGRNERVVWVPGPEGEGP